jgi:hypothetical protein
MVQAILFDLLETRITEPQTRPARDVFIGAPISDACQAKRRLNRRVPGRRPADLPTRPLGGVIDCGGVVVRGDARARSATWKESAALSGASAVTIVDQQLEG